MKNAWSLDVSFDLLPAQQRLVESEAKIVAFVGGFGSGKTRGAVYKSLVLGFQNEPCVGIFVEPTYTMVRDVAVRAFQEVLRETEIPYDYKSNDHVLRVADTFDILFRSGDRPEMLIGTNAGWAVIDEPAKQSEEAAKMALGRIRDPRAKLRQLVLTGTPEGFNWFYDWCQDPTVDVIKTTTRDNPFLDESYIEVLKSKYTEEEVRAYINGDFVRFEGAWYRAHPAITPPIEVGPLNEMFFRSPYQVSDQLLIGVDTAGGMDRDRSAVAVIDKRDRALVACWADGKATLDRLCDVVVRFAERYTKSNNSPVPGLYPHTYDIRKPLVLVEVNGIGRATWQELTGRRQLPCVEVKTTDASRYANLLAARKAVEEGLVYGPALLQEEARDLVVEDGKFKGPKDLSMAIGFCLHHLTSSPYVPPTPIVKPHQRVDLTSRLGRRGGWL